MQSETGDPKLISNIINEFSLIRERRHQDVGQCLIREYWMACITIQGDFNRDIYEGFRALLEEKDKNPKWAPSKVEFVIDSMVDRYFEPVNDKD